jgi:hypothetical protein
MERSMKSIDWRGIVGTLPLPMLALAASYGVYKFNLLFTPPWVAIVSAAAYEMTYVGLAVLIGLDERQRNRAGLISVGAVVVSILYNSLAGFFHRRPNALEALPWWGDGILSAMHGAPLALVAYFVADLLLHREEAPRAMPALSYARIPDQPVYPAPVLINADRVTSNTSNAATDYTCKHCGAIGLTKAEQLAHGRQHARERKAAGLLGDKP